MTLTTEAPARTHDLQVRTDPAGKPMAVRHEGQIWLVDPSTDSRHWFERNTGRDTQPTAAAGSGDPAGIEYWRIQVRTGSNSALQTFTLRREPHSTRWRLDSIEDGC
jgi:hypothetical protein